MAASVEEEADITPADVSLQLAGKNNDAAALATAQACVFRTGLVHLRGALLAPAEDQPDGQHAPAVLLAHARDAAQRLGRHTRALLRRQGVEYNAEGASWRFNEAAGRGRGRLDLRAGQDCASLAAVDAALSPVLRPLLSSLLGSDYVQAYGGVVEALPGAGNQAWHLDGEPLFADIELPPHAVTVFVALGAVDADSGLGSPQFIPRSHTRRMAQAIDEGAEVVPIWFDLSPGDIILFDYRTIHRGIANTSTKIRPLLYRVFTKPWFRDVANFATTPLQRDSTPDLLDVLNGVAAPWPASDPDKLEY